MSLKRILVCPGQGRFQAGSLALLAKYKNDKNIARLLDEADASVPQLRLSRYIREPETVLDVQKTVVQQPLLILTSYIQKEIVKMRDNVDLVNSADYMIGHSLGEISALVLQGVFSLEKGLQIGYERGRLMQSVVDSGAQEYGMYAVLFPAVHYGLVIEQLRQERLHIANYNTYGQVVVSGVKSEMEGQLEAVSVGLAGSRIRLKTVDLHVSIPFHHSILRPIREELAQVLQTEKSTLRVPVVSNFDGSIISGSTSQQIHNIVEVTSEPVLFSKCLENFLAKEDTTYEFTSFGTTTQSIIKRFYADFSRLGRTNEKPVMRNRLALEQLME